MLRPYAGWTFSRPLHFWINEGLMTIFFFLVVDLEIRREIFEGELASTRKAARPVAAAAARGRARRAAVRLSNQK